MKNPKLFFVSTFTSLFCFIAFGQSVPTLEPEAPRVEKVTVVVEFNEPPTAGELAAWDRRGVKLERISPYQNNYFNRAYRTKINFADEGTLAKSPNVRKVEESQKIILQSVTEDPLYADQWYLQNSGYDVREDITDIRSVLRPGQVEFDIGFQKVKIQIEENLKEDVIVAVLDTGVDIEHPDLADNIVKNAAECDGDGRIPLGEATEDKDGNGYKGDCVGINLTTAVATQKNRPFDDVGHGTHVAGVISAVSGNGLGLNGLSSHIKILPVKLIAKEESKQRVALTDRVAEGILYAVARGAKVINMSIGWPVGWNTDHVYEAILEARRQGVFVVAAAGNNNHPVPTYPCSYAQVICVGATQNDGALAAFSNYGAQVDIVAPGDRILSTFPTTMVPKYYSVNGYEMKNGTSQAAPIVAASIAALAGSHPQDRYEESLARLLAQTQVVRTGDKYYSQGQARVDLALAPVAAPAYLRFLFKEKAIVSVNQQREFKLSFVVQNLSSLSQNVNVKLTTQTVGTSFIQTEKSVVAEPWSNVTFEFAGHVDNLLRERELKFIANINGVEKRAQSILALELDQMPSLQKWSIQNSKDINNLISVADVDGQNPGQYFSSFKRAESGTGIQLVLWEKTKNQLAQRGTSVLADLKTPIGLFTGDANADGTKDLMLLGLKAGTPNATLIIYYFNGQLQPLWPAHPYLQISDETPIFNYARLADYRAARWFRLPGSGLAKELLVPSIIDNAYKPKLDMSRDERRGPLVKGSHVYYLEPHLKEDGSPALRARIIDSYNWMKTIRDALGLYYYEAIQPLTELGDGHYLFSAGQLLNARSIEVKLDKQFTWRDLKWSQNLMGYRYIKSDAYDVTPNGQRHELDAIYGIITLTRSHLVFVDRTDRSRIVDQYTFDLPDASEQTLNALVVSRSPNHIKVILESLQKLFGFYGQPGQALQVTANELSRSTFFDQTFSQVNLPIQMRSGESALYVDDTQMTSNNIYVQQLTAQAGFFAPLATSITLSENCRRLNPAKWSGENSYRINVLCRIGAKSDQMEIRSLPIDAQ